MRANGTILGALALLATGVAGFAVGKTASQASPMAQGKEYQWLESLAGDYTAKVSGMLGESDATSQVESALGGLWSIRHFEGTMMNQPYQGIEILGFDPIKDKFVSVWADSMTPMLTTLEGIYDADTKTLTMRGESIGMDGEEGVMVNTTEFAERGMVLTMNIEGQPGPLMTIDYARKE